MTHFAVNWLAVVLAALASMAFGFAWYMALSRPWLAAVGKSREQINPGDATPFIWTAAAELVMAYFIALLTPLLTGATTLSNGLLIAAHMWLGFVVTTLVINHRYQRAPWALTAIDGGHLLGVLLVQGAVIGLFG